MKQLGLPTPQASEPNHACGMQQLAFLDCGQRWRSHSYTTNGDQPATVALTRYEEPTRQVCKPRCDNWSYLLGVCFPRGCAAPRHHRMQYRVVYALPCRGTPPQGYFPHTGTWPFCIAVLACWCGVLAHTRRRRKSEHGLLRAPPPTTSAMVCAASADWQVHTLFQTHVGTLAGWIFRGSPVSKPYQYM